jgi:dihydroorotase
VILAGPHGERDSGAVGPPQPRIQETVAPMAESLSLTLRRPDDLHLHLRDGALLAQVLPHSAAAFGRGLVMPNTEPPVVTGADAERYRKEILSVRPDGSPFEPLMTIKIVPSTTPAIVRDAAAAGVVAGKLYPEGVTTNSSDGVRDVLALGSVFAAMSDAGLVLCLHGESPDAFCLDREERFLFEVLPELARSFPDLRIVLEHVSTAAAVDWVQHQPGTNVAATITVHHLLLTLDDVVGGMLAPHHFCKPVAKRPADRAAIVAAAVSGDPRFFLGTDSAPHPRAAKESAHGCAGVFTAPVALPLLATVFEEQGALAALEGFCSVHGAAFYGLPPNPGTVRLVREPWTVPADYDGVVPLNAGSTLPWQVESDENGASA